MNEYLENLWSNNSALVLEVAYNGLLLIAVIFASRLAVKFLHRWINKAEGRINGLDETLRPFLCTISSVAVYAVALVIALDFFGVNTSSILALLGAAGLAIALALKDTLGNIAAGIMLLILRPFRIGDAIQFGSTVGSVVDMGLFTITLETPDGLYISSPNSSLWGGPVTNFTRNGKRRMDLEVGIAYTDSIDAGFAALQSIIDNEPRFMAEPAPQVIVVAMADSSVNLQLRAWANNDNYWGAYRDNTKKVKEVIEAAGLSIPFPQTDVHLISQNKD